MLDYCRTILYAASTTPHILTNVELVYDTGTYNTNGMVIIENNIYFSAIVQ